MLNFSKINGKTTEYIEAKVIDVITKAPVVGMAVYIFTSANLLRSAGTMSNSEGIFTARFNKDEVLKFYKHNYETFEVQASKLKGIGTIELAPKAIQTEKVITTVFKLPDTKTNETSNTLEVVN